VEKYSVFIFIEVIKIVVVDFISDLGDKIVQTYMNFIHILIKMIRLFEKGLMTHSKKTGSDYRYEPNNNSSGKFKFD